MSEKIAMLKIEYLPVDALENYERNTRKHGNDDVEGIVKSIKKYGFNDPIGLWSDHNVIVEGHGRLMAAKKLGMTEVPCIRLDHLTDEERREYGIMHNKTAELSEWDFEKLEEELAELDLSDFGLDFGTEYSDHEWFESGDKGEAREGEEEYSEFLEKFEEKHTSDDCYTPPNIYDAVCDYVAETYGVNKKNFVRPFYPGGDYATFKYKSDSIVVDNPPFSILSEIVAFYLNNNIKYFLFAPSLSTLSSARYDNNAAICVGASITYENGAVVQTSFLTNLESIEIKARTDTNLYKKIEEINKENSKKLHRELPSYEYPDAVVTAAMMNKYSKYGIEFKVIKEASLYIRELDAQKEIGKTIFGSGFLLSEKAAAEKAAAEKAAAEKAAAEKFELSERELELQKALKD